MALLFMDSFDHYAAADLSEKYGANVGASLATTSGRRGGGCARVGTGASLATTLAPASTTAIVGVAMKLNFVAASSDLLAILQTGAVQLTVAVASTGVLTVYRGTSSQTALGSSAAGLFPFNTYVYVELKAVIDPSAGSVTVRLNEVPVLTLTGVNTAQTGVAGWTMFKFLAPGGGNTNDYDDLYVLDGAGAAPLNDVLGDCRVDARYPTAEGASSAWTPSSGSDNALMVDETAPNDDTDYNSTVTVGATDTHVVQDAPVAGAVLFGVQLVLAQKKSDAGTCAIAPVVRHAGVDQVGTAVSPGTTYAFAVTPYGVNPGTGAAWTEAEFNAAEFGYRRTA